MPEQKRKRPYSFGRVFFPGPSTPVPPEVRFQPLGNHVGNVVELVKLWKGLENSARDRIIEAAKIHDSGKPERFEIQAKFDAQGQFKQYIYSFKGHRFLAQSKDLWAKTLAIGHHDFSIKEIARDAYQLKKQQQYAEILAKDPLTYARELYILEMCDQLEAELACRILGDEQQAESRTFMDYTISQDPDHKDIYKIDPWPFQPEEVRLTFKYWSMQPTAEEKVQLETSITDPKLLKQLEAKSDKSVKTLLDKIVKDWWKEQPPHPPTVKPDKTVRIQPLFKADLTKPNYQSIYQDLAGFEPNPMQEKMLEAIKQNPNPAILLKSSTGSGKLEAVLFAALAQNYRLFLPLPARSLLEDQKQRVEKYLKQLSKLQPDREVSLVVDTGSQMHRWVYQNGEEKELNINSRRHLYKGDVILTTLDKFLYRYFAYGDKQKSFVFPLRIHQGKTLICFDECHSYDKISFTNFSGLVKSLYEAGRSLVLMTATLPPEHIQRFQYLEEINFIDDAKHSEALRQFQQETLKQPYRDLRSFHWYSEIQRDSQNPEKFQASFAEILLQEWESKSDCRLIAVVETVKDAAAIFQNLKDKLQVNIQKTDEFLFLYHGRIAEHLRSNIYQKIQHRDEKKSPYLLITTRAIEVGCDLNSQVLVSQICPPENLIQRVGRCNRKGNIPDAKVIVVGDRIPDFANTLTQEAWEAYQKTLKRLSEFQTDKIQACISRSQHIDDYRVVELFSMLHEYVYEADLTCQPLHERGLIPTRSWTPSVTLKTHQSDGIHSISVPIDRLCSGESYANIQVYETKYDQENSCWNTEHPLTSGPAYSKNISVRIGSEPEGVGTEESLPQYPYNPELGFVELPKIFIQLKISKTPDVKLLYDKGKSKAILIYPKSLDEADRPL